MKFFSTAALMGALMVGAALAGGLLLPDQRRADRAPAYLLQDVVPARFGSWTEVADAPVAVVNPQTQQIVDKLYSQVLMRTYVNPQGYRVMLSMAYGDDQRGGMQAHMPEVCYPAQGFQVQAQARQQLVSGFGSIPVVRLQTRLGPRFEPVTYWFNLGDETIKTGSRWEKRWVELRFSLTGQAPAGLLFRVSSIDPDAVHAFSLQDQFVKELLSAVTPADRVRLSGIPG